jgi:hypothetical protein
MWRGAFGSSGSSSEYMVHLPLRRAAAGILPPPGSPQTHRTCHRDARCARAFPVLLVPQLGSLGQRACRMSDQDCLRLVQRRQRLERRPCHRDMGATVEEVPHRTVHRDPTQPLPLLRPRDCRGDWCARSDAHTLVGRKKSANCAGQISLSLVARYGLGLAAQPPLLSTSQTHPPPLLRPLR